MAGGRPTKYSETDTIDLISDISIDTNFLDDIRIDVDTDLSSDIDIELDTDFQDIDFEDKEREAGSLSYNNFRNTVFARDGYICQECQKQFPKDKLEAHHIKPFSVAPELKFHVNNGLTLCHDCHVKTDNYGRRNKPKKAAV